MPDHFHITSTKNPRIKYLLELQSKAKTRRTEGKFVIEGQLEVKRAAEKGYEIENLLVNERIISMAEVKNLVPSFNKPYTMITDEIYEKLSYRKTTGGIIALASPKSHGLNDLKVSSNPLILIVESVEKPGNLGALLRTADAAGIDAIIICDPQTDVYNPNVIRSSIGGVFTTSIAVSTSEHVIEWLKENNIKSYATTLTASTRYDLIDYTKPCAIVFGTESTGLSEVWLQHSDQNIIIPMQGVMDSLNVSVSAAIVVFEAARQRGF